MNKHVALTSAVDERLVEGPSQEGLRQLLEELLDESCHHVHTGVRFYVHVAGRVKLRPESSDLLLSSTHPEYTLLV